MCYGMTEVLKFLGVVGKVYGGGGGDGSMGSGLNTSSKILPAVNTRDLCRRPMSYCFVVPMVDSLRIASHASQFKHGECHRLHWGTSLGVDVVQLKTIFLTCIYAFI